MHFRLIHGVLITRRKFIVCHLKIKNYSHLLRLFETTLRNLATRFVFEVTQEEIVSKAKS